jgi:outer membrane lipoprotein SlyB
MAARGHGKGAIEILADSITVDGRARKLEARIESVPYELRGRGVTGEDAAKVGVGAAGGAVVGGVVTGKTKGAVIGGVVGAAAGAAVASQTATKDVVVAARTPVQVVLTAPLVIR